MNRETLKAIRYEFKGDCAKAIMKAKYWLDYDISPMYMRDWFVVCTWCDLHDGEKSNIEAKVTICITPEILIAEQVYKNLP